MNKVAGLPEMSRMYRQPKFKTMIQQDDRGMPVSVEYSMNSLNPQFDQKKATKELSEKQATIRSQKKAYGGSIEKAENGTKVRSATYQIKKGDNLIKIARQFGLNSLDEILSLNPQIKNPNMIYEGQVLNLPKDKMKQNGKLDAASVSDKMPNYDQVAYAELPESVRAKVDAYASAINDHKIKYTDVPTLYRQQAYNQSIRQDTNNAAPMIATKALMAP